MPFVFKINDCWISQINVINLEPRIRFIYEINSVIRECRVNFSVTYDFVVWLIFLQRKNSLIFPLLKLTAAGSMGLPCLPKRRCGIPVISKPTVSSQVEPDSQLMEIPNMIEPLFLCNVFRKPLIIKENIFT